MKSQRHDKVNENYTQVFTLSEQEQKIAPQKGVLDAENKSEALASSDAKPSNSLSFYSV